MKELKKNKGITLIALVITIIVLLILAGVSLNSVFSDKGIFSRAKQAVDKYEQAKAREILELVLDDAQMKKYTSGLNDTQLDAMIGQVGSLLPKEDETSNYQLVIVEGHIFEIDRSVPEIVDYKGPADGVIISASVSGNNGWFKAGETINVTVTGIIKTYSGGTITNVSATKGGTAISDFSINSEGRYIINNITTNTTIEIKAKDSKNKENSKTVPITIKLDGTAPTVATLTAEANGKNITISATGHDKNASDQEESGIDKFHYTITPTEGVTPTSGDFGITEKPKITTTVETTYTISVTATDKVGNGPSAEKTATVKVEIPFGEKETVKKTASDGEWWIPEGFREASDSSSTIQGGKVIEDKSGNQWVWIPCYLDDNETKKGQQQYSQATEYKRTDFGKQDGLYSNYSETLDATDAASIKNYGGFYIGRYEAGKVGTDTVVIKRDQTPYKSINIEDCKTKSTNFASANSYATDKVYTKLVSSYAWDTALTFIDKTVSNYSINSSHSTPIKNTGLTEAVCNIYDIGDNVWEHTSEVYYSSGNPVYYCYRGSIYYGRPSGEPAGHRAYHNGGASTRIGFRPLLYIK